MDNSIRRSDGKKKVSRKQAIRDFYNYMWLMMFVAFRFKKDLKNNGQDKAIACALGELYRTYYARGPYNAKKEAVQRIRGKMFRDVESMCYHMQRLCRYEKYKCTYISSKGQYFAQYHNGESSFYVPLLDTRRIESIPKNERVRRESINPPELRRMTLQEFREAVDVLKNEKVLAKSFHPRFL